MMDFICLGVYIGNDNIKNRNTKINVFQYVCGAIIGTLVNKIRDSNADPIL